MNIPTDQNRTLPKVPENLWDTMHAIMPKAPYVWLDEIVRVLPSTTINTLNEIASFIAQIAHESAEFTHLEENLNYSATRLMQVWPRQFHDMTTAQQYEHNPEKLANYIYANRLGNGGPETNDGWRYRGHGPIQITGKRNYSLLEEASGLPVLSDPWLLTLPRGGIASAVWYWNYAKLDQHDDDRDVRAETILINGGTNGLVERQAYFDAIIKHLDD